MTPLLDIIDGRLVLTCSPRDKELVRKVPGAKWIRGTDSWEIPLGIAGCLIARAQFGERLGLGPGVMEWGFAEKDRLGHLLGVKQEHGTALAPGFDRLRPYQVDGTYWMGQAFHALLTDEMGLGKTVQVLSALRLWAGIPDAPLGHPWPVLIICTNSMKHTWADEWEKWGPAHGGITTVGGTAGQRRKQLALESSVVIINWESLRLHSRLAPYGSTRLSDAESTPKELDEIGFRTVIADEAHKAANPGAKQTRAWWNLSHKAEYRVALTGTPLTGTPDTLWAIAHGLWPENFPRKSLFLDRYCHAGQNMWGGFEVYGFREENKEELFSYLDPFMLRRTKAEVAPDIPEKTYSVRHVSMEGKQEKAYRTLETEMLTEVDGEFLLADSPLTLAGRLTQLAAATPVVEDGKVVALTSPSCKLDALLDVLDEAPGDPLVVFASSRKLIDLCAKALTKAKITFVELTGAVEAGLRSQGVGRFQDGEVQVALCTLGAAAEGITLTRASRALFLQRSWSLVQNKQAEDRIHRIGQAADKVEIVDVVTLDTIEDDVHSAGEMKEGWLEELLRDRARRKGSR